MKHFDIYKSAGTAVGRRALRLLRTGKQTLEPDFPVENTKRIIEEADPFLLFARDQFVRYVLKQSAPQLRMIELEWKFSRGGCPTLFLEDADFVEWLYNQGAEVEASALKLPWPVFSIAFPSRMRLNNVELRGCVYGDRGYGEKVDSYCELFEEVGKHFGDIYPVPFNVDCVVEWFKNSQYHEKRSQESSFDCIFQCGIETNYCVCTREDMIASMNGEKSINYVDFEHGSSSVQLSAAVPVYDRIVGSLLIYLQAFPDALLPGFPLNLSGQSDKSFAGKGSTINLKLKPFHCQIKREIVGDRSMAPHMRRGHWAYLKAWRYTKGGEPRYIWKKGGLVNKAKIDPFTAQKMAQNN